MAKQFAKYGDRGAYHWNARSKNHRRHNAFLSARYQVCLDLLGDVREQIVLDLGCGDGALAGRIAAAGAHVIGVDPSEAGLAFAREEFARRDLRGDFLTDILEVAPASVDAVVCAEVIEHVDDPAVLFSSILRVLKPGGIAVISTPIRLTEVPLDEEHVKEYFPSEFEALCAAHFDVVTMRQAVPAAAHDLLHCKRDPVLLFVNFLMRARSAWFNRNALLDWPGPARYFKVQFAKVRKPLAHD